MRNVRITCSFDMRAPTWGAPITELYAAALEMAVFSDRVGVDCVGVMEHHGSEDGYLPRPFLLASAMAALTKRVTLSLGAVILPLHDPVAVAEEIAVLDLISNGRFRLIFGAGYVPSEFAMFQRSMHDRAKLMDRGIEIILRALKGERFEVDGRPIFVRPLPIRAPEDIIMVGGGVAAAAKRAARFNLGFGPMAPGLVEVYLDECRKRDQAPKEYWNPTPGMPMSIHLCEDPDEGWATIERHATHVITEYARWAEQEGDGSNSPFKGLTDPKVLRQAGLFVAWTPEQLLARVPDMREGQNLNFWPLVGGLAPEEGWKSLRLLEQTLPELKAKLAALD